MLVFITLKILCLSCTRNLKKKTFVGSNNGTSHTISGVLSTPRNVLVTPLIGCAQHISIGVLSTHIYVGVLRGTLEAHQFRCAITRSVLRVPYSIPDSARTWHLASGVRRSSLIIVVPASSFF